MKIIRFVDHAGNIRLGTPTDNTFTTATALDGNLFTSLTPTKELLSVAKLLAPIEPPNILCIGLNYKRHAEESGMAVPDRPLLFIKPTTTLSNPGDAIVHPRTTEELDYECELAVVIGDRKSVV